MKRVNIEVGPLLNIQVHSYQAYESRNPETIQGWGESNHFEVFVFRNTDLVGGTSVEKYDFSRTGRNIEMINTILDTMKEPEILLS